MSRDALRLVAAVCGLVAVVALFRVPLTDGLAPRLSPLADEVGLGDVVPAGAARGFLLRVGSEPAGATVRVDGIERGTTPLFGNVPCRQGEEVVIEVLAEGFEPWVRRVQCREGGSLTATARLQRSVR